MVPLFLFPLPEKVALKGSYAEIGTTTFTFPMSLPPSAQLHKGLVQYDVLVQAWFPVPFANASITMTLRRIFGISGAVLWTSGEPRRQNLESKILLDAVTSEHLKGLPSFIISHLSLARTNSQFFEANIFSSQEKFGPKKFLLQFTRTDCTVGPRFITRPVNF